MSERREPGVSPPISVPPGVRKAQELKAAGFSDSEVAQWSQTQTKQLQAAGFKPSEIDAYWGSSRPEAKGLRDFFDNNINIYSIDNPKVAGNPMDAFAAGWDLSVTGLVINRRAPATVLPENAGLLDRVAHGAGLMLGDAPAAVAGFFGGAAAGGGAGAVVAAPTGETAGVVTVPLGAVVGAGIGSAAVPEGGRQILLDTYAVQSGKIKTWEDALEVVTHGLIETTKAGVIGGVAAPVGGKVGGALTKAGASPVVAAGGNAVSQALTATAVGGAMNGEVPDAKDFEAGAILALTFVGAEAAANARARGRVKHNLEEVYRRTGIPPWQAVELAKRSSRFRAEIMQQDVNGEPVMRDYRAAAPPDPEPFSRGRAPGGPAGAATGGPKPRPEAAKPAERPAARLALPAPETLYVKNIPEAMNILRGLEGSGDDAVSPAGAIGRYQITPGTARQYMGDDFDVKTLFDPAVNERVAGIIIADLYKRYQGNMNAIAIAYNAGPGRAGQYLAKGPGKRLRAELDKRMRGGIRYVEEAAQRDEGFLPLETQRYLANLRRRFGANLEGAGGDDMPPPSDRKFPSYDLVRAELAGAGDGGGEPPGGGPRRIGGPDDDGGFWSRQNEETLIEEILDNVGEEKTPAINLDPDRFLSQFISELTPARRLDDALIRGGEMDRLRDLGAEDMFRQTYASDTRAGVFVRYGAIDPITLDIKPGSKSILDAVRAVREENGDLQGWIAYMLAKRTVDKAAQGVKTGFNPKAAEALATNKKAQRKYQRATDIFQDVMTSALEYGRDSGLFSQEQIDRMVRDNPTYVSMRRIMGDDETFKGAGRSFRPRDPLKRMEGSDRQIVDPVMASIDNMRLIIKNADRNRAIGHIVGMAERGELEGLGIKRIEDQQTIKAVDEKVFKPYGIPTEGQDAYSSLVAFKAASGWSKNDFLFFRNGKAERWTASDPLLADLLRKVDTPAQANFVLDAFTTFARLQRAGIVSAPDFPIRNVLRDQLTSFVFDPLHPPPFVTFMKGIFHVLKQDDVFQDAMAKGALGSAATDIDTNWLQRDMDAIFTETNTWDRAVNAVKHPVEFMQLIQERLDAAARVGYYVQAKQKGIQSIKAATLSRKAYLDFAERGTAQVADTMARVTPFFRPSLLGLKQFGEAIRERPASTAAYAVATITLPMVALYALNFLQDQVLPDGEKYSDLPRWQRDHYFVSPDIAGVRVRMRLPPEIGWVFGGLVNRVLDYAAKKDKHAFEKWAKAFLSDYLPPVMPTLVQTPVEAVTNHNFFTGRALVPSSLEKNTGYMQYTPSTSETGKALSRVLGEPGLDIAEFSPIQFDHFVSGWTGTVGATVLRILDVPFSESKKPWEVADIPFVGSFVTRNPGMSAQPVQDFYEGMAELEKKQADFALAMRRAEGGQPGEIELTAPASQYAQAVLPIKEAIQVQAAAIQGINSNPEMTADEKREAIDALYPMLVQTAKRGLETVDELRKAAEAEPEEAEPIPEPPPNPNAPAEQAPLPGANRGMVPFA